MLHQQYLYHGNVTSEAAVQHDGSIADIAFKLFGEDIVNISVTLSNDGGSQEQMEQNRTLSKLYA